MARKHKFPREYVDFIIKTNFTLSNMLQSYDYTTLLNLVTAFFVSKQLGRARITINITSTLIHY